LKILKYPFYLAYGVVGKNKKIKKKLDFFFCSGKIDKE